MLSKRQKKRRVTRKNTATTYMKLSGIRTGLLINFHSQPLIDGIKRFLL